MRGKHAIEPFEKLHVLGKDVVPAYLHQDVWIQTSGYLVWPSGDACGGVSPSVFCEMFINIL